MHGSQRYSYSSGVRRGPPLLLPLYHPPSPPLPFQTIRFIRKSCTRNGRSRERENTCAHVCMGTKSMERFSRTRFPPPSKRFVKSSGENTDTPPCVYIFHVERPFYRIGQKRELESFLIESLSKLDWRKISNGNFEFEDGSVENLENLKLIGILFEIFSLVYLL